jgi:hypothetical protein
VARGQVEREGDIPGGLESFLARLGQTTSNDLDDTGRDATFALERRWVGRENRVEALRGRLACKRPAAGKHLVQHGAQTWRPSRCAAKRWTRARTLHAALVGDEQVLGLDVAMDDAFVVRGGQALGDLRAVVERARHAERPADQHPRCVSLQQLEHDERDTTGRADIMDNEDVGMGQGGGRARFAFEPGEPRRVGGDRLGQHLDRNIATKLVVARAINLPHAA